MARLKLFNSNDSSDSVEVVALLSRYQGKDQHHSDKQMGMELLDLLDDGSGMMFLPNTRVYNEYGFSNGILTEMVSEIFNDLSNGIELVEFYWDGIEGRSDIRSRHVTNLNKSGGRNSRRYVVVEYCDRFYLTDVVGLADSLHWYKNDRDRNETSLQWINYVSIVKSGSAY